MSEQNLATLGPKIPLPSAVDAMCYLVLLDPEIAQTVRCARALHDSPDRPRLANPPTDTEILEIRQRGRDYLLSHLIQGLTLPRA